MLWQGLQLVEHMAVAMLLYVRATLLEGDYTSTLRRLLKYPPVEHVHTLVERALQLRRAFGADANGAPAVAGGFPRGGSRGGGVGFAPPQDAGARAPPSARGTAADQQRWQQRGTAPAGGGGSYHAAAGHAAPAQAEAAAAEAAAAAAAADSTQLASRMEAPLELLTALLKQLVQTPPPAAGEAAAAGAEAGAEAGAGAGAGAARPASESFASDPVAVRRALAELRAVQRVLSVRGTPRPGA